MTCPGAAGYPAAMWPILAACTRATPIDWRPPPVELPRPHTGDDDTAGTGDTAEPERCRPPVGRGVQLPVDTVLPGATVPLGDDADTPQWPAPPVVVTDGDAPLLFSDSPETVDGPGVLYRDVLSGPGRLYLYHTSGAEALRYAILARGQGAASVEITEAGVAGPSTDYVYTGRMAARRWLDAAILPTPRTVAVPDGQWVALDPALDVRVAPDRLLHGLWDVEVAGTVELAFVAVRDDGTDPVAAIDTLAALPRDSHDRGTFVPSDRAVDLPCLDPRLGSVRVRLADGTEDPAVLGVDALGGGTPETLDGNYGVRYTLTSRVQSTDGRSIAVLLAPRGGPLAGAAQVGDGLFRGSVFDFPTDADDVRPGDAVFLGAWDPLHPDVSVTWTPAGGSTLPVDVLFVAYRP